MQRRGGREADCQRHFALPPGTWRLKALVSAARRLLPSLYPSTLAHLQTLRTARDPQARYRWKLRVIAFERKTQPQLVAPSRAKQCVPSCAAAP
jgi:hypothetical protein